MLTDLCSVVRYQIPLADAGQFVGDDEADKDATAEVFLVVAGLSTAAFALAFNVPFIIAPSAMYTAREPGYVCMYDVCLMYVYEEFHKEHMDGCNVDGFVCAHKEDQRTRFHVRSFRAEPIGDLLGCLVNQGWEPIVRRRCLRIAMPLAETQSQADLTWLLMWWRHTFC